MRYFFGRDWDDNIYYGICTGWGNAISMLPKNYEELGISISIYENKEYFIKDLRKEKEFYSDYLGAKFINLTPNEINIGA